MSSNWTEEKSICLKCGGFYPVGEIVKYCIWCSIEEKFDTEASVVEETLSHPPKEIDSSASF